MWPGPYGEGGSRKYLLASLDQSLRRLGLDYVDIFYSHRFDPDTPLDETMAALATAVQQGKALYVGISSYSSARLGRGRREPVGRPRRAAADPPAVVLDVQPLDRGRPAPRHAGDRRRRLHRVLSAGPRPAHRPLPRRHPGRLAGGHRRRPGPRHGHRGSTGQGAGAGRDGRASGASARAARPGMGPPRPADDLPRHRSEQRCPARGEPRRLGQPRLHRPTSSRPSTSTPPTPTSTSGPASSNA